MSEAAQQEAVIAHLSATVDARGIDELQRMAKLPVRYVEVWVMERPADEFRGGGVRSGGRMYRLLTRVVAENYDDAQEYRRRVSEALEDQQIPLSLGETTPVRRAVADDPIAVDDRWWSGVSEWTYATDQED